MRDLARPLPPLDAPLRVVASELASRAARGDARAACRLAAEYEWCDALGRARSMAAARVAQLPPLEAGRRGPDLLADQRQAAEVALDSAEGRFSQHCADAPPLHAARRVGYWRQAALRGHPAALRHYAIGNAFRFNDLLDALPELERYRREAGALALRSANAGDPAMMYALAMAHAEGSDGRYRPFLAQTLPPDAGRALVWFRRLQATPTVQRLPETHVVRLEIEGYLSSLSRLVPPDELRRAEAALAGYRPPMDGSADQLPQLFPNGGLLDVDRNDCDQQPGRHGGG
ncbi:hypothetical protein [uncultured Luteimonas sp.]|uniref:hypothetical protein n=1 Tax=uncultured Luteimonas sp. TaxID=453144 RepID=UPI002638AA8C|nr:hypothetical protein [uncultured Luteimonas sp.]